MQGVPSLLIIGTKIVDDEVHAVSECPSGDRNVHQ